jgi:sterol desaturase/sphingolipid hydroxylase (fatty acid hydroxylase superfamily)
LIQITTFISGFFGGTLFEYVMHHYIFHIVSHIKLIQRILYFLHGNHHEFSRDEQRLFMLPLLGLLIIGILFIIFYFAISRFAFLFLSSMILGYMLYSLMHYSMRAFKPPHILRSLWKHHYLQHYKFPDKAYGVSSPLWDYLFGTMPSTTEDRPNKA